MSQSSELSCLIKMYSLSESSNVMKNLREKRVYHCYKNQKKERVGVVYEHRVEKRVLYFYKGVGIKRVE